MTDWEWVAIGTIICVAFMVLAGVVVDAWWRGMGR